MTKTPEGQLVRLNVNITPENAEDLKKIASERGITVTEVIRRAIAIYKWVEDERSAGRTIISEDSRGKHRRELVLL